MLKQSIIKQTIFPEPTKLALRGASRQCFTKTLLQTIASLLFIVPNSYADALDPQTLTNGVVDNSIKRQSLLQPVDQHALPKGGQIKAAGIGQAAGSISQNGANMLVQQHQEKMTVNWSSFDIGEQAAVRFTQPSVNSIALNQIASQVPSQILGKLSANGQVWLVNQSGVLFGQNAQVDVNSLVASSLALNTQDFEAGRYNFSNNNQSSTVVNEGVLLADNVVLLGSEVINKGTILTANGQTVMAAGEKVSIQINDMIEVKVDQRALHGLVENQGSILASNGRVMLSASTSDAILKTAVNNSGLIEASRIVNKNGEIYLEADAISNSGVISAVGSEAADGGKITLEGNNISSGRLIADGANGGEINIQSTNSILASDKVSAKGRTGQGGRVAYKAEGKISKSSTSETDVSGHTTGGSMTTAAKYVLTSGSYYADGLGQGGIIDITAGEDILTLSANMRATGGERGGLIRLGGAFQGGKKLASSDKNGMFVERWGEVNEMSNAETLLINDTSHIDVSSKDGVGGTAIVWSDLETTLLGSIDATGLKQGGAVEISSAQTVQHAGFDGVNIGQGGQLLLDPKNIYIRNLDPDSTLVHNKIIGFGHITGSGTNIESGDFFGKSVALDDSGLILAVGAPVADGALNDVEDSGAVYLFRFDDSHFTGGTLESVITKGATGGKNIDFTLDIRDQFGSGLALNGDATRLAVGAGLDSGYNNTLLGSGAVHLFDFDLDLQDPFKNGQHAATIGHDYASSGNANDFSMPLGIFDQFGISVALNQTGDMLLVGAVGDDGFTNLQTDSGAAYLFNINGAPQSMTGVTLTKTIGNGYTGANAHNMAGLLEINDFFGRGVALNDSGDRFAISANGDDGFNNATADSGAVYLFSAADATFATTTHEGTMGDGYVGGKNVNVDLDTFDAFGSAVAMTNNAQLLFVGAESDDGFNNIGNAGNGAGDSGAVYIYKFTDGSYAGPSLDSILGYQYTGGKNVSADIITKDFFGTSVAIDGIGEHTVVGLRGGDGNGDLLTDSGEVYLFSHAYEVNHGNNGINTQLGLSIVITPRNLTNILKLGTDVDLIASNDIFVEDAVIVNNDSGAGGDLSMSAGRSIQVQADIDTDDANLTLVANATLADGVVDPYRDPGQAVVTLDQTASIDTGAGDLDISLKANDATKTNHESGDITLSGGATANTIKVVNAGSTDGAGVILNNTLTATATTGDTIVVAGDHFTNNVGNNVFINNPNTRWLVWTNHPTLDQDGGLLADFKQYNAIYGQTAVAHTGNGYLHEVAPTLTVSLVETTEKVYDGNNLASLAPENYVLSGVIDNDSVVYSKPVTGLYDNAQVGITKLVTAQPIEFLSMTNGNMPVFGYSLDTTASGNIGNILPNLNGLSFNDAHMQIIAATQYTPDCIENNNVVPGHISEFLNSSFIKNGRVHTKELYHDETHPIFGCYQ